MPLVNMKKNAGANSKSLPVRVTTMDAELEFHVDVSTKFVVHDDFYVVYLFTSFSQLGVVASSQISTALIRLDKLEVRPGMLDCLAL